MKKILLALAAFSYISAAPSFAVKLIMNNEKDRIVPSRLMGSYYNPADMNDNDYQRYESTKNTFIQTGVYVIPGYRAEEYNRLYKPLLTRDLREELAGVYWNYPDYDSIKIQYERRAAEMRERGFTPSADKKAAKKHEREAADYFYRDTLNDPERIIQSGYDILNVEE